MVPESASEGIGIHGADGSGFIVSVPVGVSVADGVTAGDGSTVYAGTDGHPDVTVTPLESGVRISTVLWDDSQSTSFGYPLPEGVEGEIQSDGSVILTRALEVDNGGAPTEADVIVGQIEPAWAVDANGKAVPTTYVLADGMLTQKVDTTDAAFPVVADPTWGVHRATPDSCAVDPCRNSNHRERGMGRHWPHRRLRGRRRSDGRSAYCRHLWSRVPGHRRAGHLHGRCRPELEPEAMP